MANDRDMTDRQVQLKLMYEFATAINRSHSTRELLEIILDRCLQLTDATSGSVILVDREEGRLDIVASRGLNRSVAQGTKLKIGEGVTGWVAEHGKPLLVNDTSKEPKYIQVRKDILSELAVPIRTGETFIGVINMDSNRRNAFQPAHTEFMAMVAELAAQIFIKDKMKERIESKLKSQGVLVSAFEALERSNDLTEIFNAVMEKLREEMEMFRGMLILFDPQDPTLLKIMAGYKISDDAVQKGIYRPGEGIIGTAVAEGRTIVVKDISKEPRFLNRMKIQRHGQGVISFIASPIRIEQKVLGVLAIEKKFDAPELLEDAVATLNLLTAILAHKVRNFQEQQERTAQLITENLELRKALNEERPTGNIIGKDVKIMKVIEQVGLTANTLASVLITGETGTGKELIARALHNLSDRKSGPFVGVNCSAVPENLLEAELFGYVKGAFTGATVNRRGKFDMAHGGSLFLDEIGDMPLHLQAKILRSLEEKEIQPLGSEKTVRVDIRIIAATNKDLHRMVDEKQFRSDLFFRLNVINIHLPALRERKDDIVLLTDFFLKRYNRLYAKKVLGLDKAVQNIFSNYAWPGNIRELENAIERAVILCQGEIVDTALLPAPLRSVSEEAEDLQMSGIRKWVRARLQSIPGDELYEGVMGELEKMLVEELLVLNDYNKSRTAQRLGINRNTLKAIIRKRGVMK